MISKNRHVDGLKFLVNIKLYLHLVNSELKLKDVKKQNKTVAYNYCTIFVTVIIN